MRTRARLWIVLVGCACWLLGCANAAANAPTATPLPTTSLVATATTAPNTASIVAPSATPLPLPSATPVPTPAAPHVGVQVGHWKLENLPDELAKLREASGTYYCGYDEWEVNLPIAELVQQRLTNNGVQVDLLPATVPVGYQADAVVSIHVDGVTGAQAAVRRGWKVGTPWRASPATQLLAEEVSKAYEAALPIPPDPQGQSFDMRGYYAFAPYRYAHAVAPTTPSIIIEAGFMTHAKDRPYILTNPELAADAIADGVLAYLAERPAAGSPDFLPLALPQLVAREANTTMHSAPRANASETAALGPHTELVTLAATDGWYMVTDTTAWDIGWVREQDLRALADTSLPIHP